MSTTSQYIYSDNGTLIEIRDTQARADIATLQRTLADLSSSSSSSSSAGTSATTVYLPNLELVTDRDYPSEWSIAYTGFKKQYDELYILLTNSSNNLSGTNSLICQIGNATLDSTDTIVVGSFTPIAVVGYAGLAGNYVGAHLINKNNVTIWESFTQTGASGASLSERHTITKKDVDDIGTAIGFTVTNADLVVASGTHLSIWGHPKED